MERENPCVLFFLPSSGRDDIQEPNDLYRYVLKTGRNLSTCGICFKFQHVTATCVRHGIRGGIFKLLGRPGIDSASLCSPAGRNDNPIPTRFLATIDCSEIPAQMSLFDSVYSFSLLVLILWVSGSDLLREYTVKFTHNICIQKLLNLDPDPGALLYPVPIHGFLWAKRCSWKNSYFLDIKSVMVNIFFDRSF